MLEHEELAAAWQLRGRDAVVRAVRAAIGEARLSLQNGQYAAVDAPSLARRAREIVQDTRPLLRPVINATGILLHTGLGRAPLAGEEAVKPSRRRPGDTATSNSSSRRRARPADVGHRAALARADRGRGGDGGQQQ